MSPKSTEWLPLPLPLGWVCSDRPRGAQVCLPGRMDGRWKGLLSHQQLPAAHHGTLPRECHLHIHRASSGRSSHSMSPSFFCSARAWVSYSVFFPKSSSPLQPWCYFHMVLSIQKGLLKFQSQCSLLSMWWCSGSKHVFRKYISRCQVWMSSADISQYHSTEVNAKLQKHTDTNSLCLEYVHYFNHFNELPCFIETTEWL